MFMRLEIHQTERAEVRPSYKLMESFRPKASELDFDHSTQELL